MPRKKKNQEREPAQITGKKFSEAVLNEQSDTWRPWDDSLSIQDSALPQTMQKTILKDWLLSNRSFVEICMKHGMSLEEAGRLESKLPSHIVSLKNSQQVEDLTLTGLHTEDELNRQIVLGLLTDGLAASRKVRVMTDVMFESGKLTPLDLSRLVSTWDRILKRVGTFLTKEDLPEEAGFRSLMQMTREELTDLRSRIQEYRHYKVDIDEAEVILEEEN